MKQILIPFLAILFAAALLLGLNLGLGDIRRTNEEKELLEKMQTLLPGSTTFETEPYTGSDTIIRSVYKGETGFVIHTVTGGYAGDVSMLIGVSKEGKVTGLTVRELSETPGLGACAMTDWEFLAQFLNTDGNATVGENVDALTGATVTSKAVARCVNSAVAFVTGADIGSGATSWGG